LTGSAGGATIAKLAISFHQPGANKNALYPLRSLARSLYTGCRLRHRHVERRAVDYFVPYYVNEEQSDARGIKCGWYAMDERGNLSFGPYSCPSQCLKSGAQRRDAAVPKWLH
jgi:hypothetical protein